MLENRPRVENYFVGFSSQNVPLKHHITCTLFVQKVHEVDRSVSEIIPSESLIVYFFITHERNTLKGVGAPTLESAHA
jgi:hypothetical protein